MKTLQTSLIVILAIISSHLFSQDCNLYLPVDVGTKWETTTFNAKGKAESTSKFELIDKVSNGNDVTFTVKSSYHDKKGDEMGSHTFDAFCKDGVFEFDLDYFLNSLKSEAYEGMDVDVELDMSNYELAKFSDPVGTKLEDYNITMSMSMNGMGNMSMEMKYTNRELVSKEEKTTSAGTFPCIVVTQDISTKMSIMNTETSSKDWYSQGIGMVRSEYYSNKGKLQSYTELTKFSQ